MLFFAGSKNMLHILTLVFFVYCVFYTITNCNNLQCMLNVCNADFVILLTPFPRTVPSYIKHTCSIMTRFCFNSSVLVVLLSSYLPVCGPILDPVTSLIARSPPGLEVQQRALVRR